MIVYHGSDHIIEKPVFHGSKHTNDYGYGFYTTESIDLAKEWACGDGTISFSKLSEAMHLGKLGEQIVLKSEKAFQHIRFTGAEPADAKIWYEKKSLRDRNARREYRKTKTRSDGINELFMLDIMREEMKNGDPRLL